MFQGKKKIQTGLERHEGEEIMTCFYSQAKQFLKIPEFHCKHDSFTNFSHAVLCDPFWCLQFESHLIRSHTIVSLSHKTQMQAPLRRHYFQQHFPEMNIWERLKAFLSSHYRGKFIEKASSLTVKASNVCSLRFWRPSRHLRVGLYATFGTSGPHFMVSSQTVNV